MKIKISKAKIALGLLFLGFFVIVRYAMRDLELDIDILRESLVNLPDMAMENMRLNREISGDMWRVLIPRVERRGNLMSIQSLDVRREIKTGGEWYFFGREGIYSQDENAAVFNGIVGTMEIQDKNRTINLESPSVYWLESNDALVFSDGLTLYDTEILLTAETASMDREGVILLENGGFIQWTKPLDLY